MSALPYLRNTAIPTALSLLPPKMDTPEARNFLVAIVLQESNAEHRRQIQGPAMGFAQFEKGGGVEGVLSHPATTNHIRAVLQAMAYDFTPETSYRAIEHNDVLAMVYARLLLYSLPQRLPGQWEHELAWSQYLKAWRPGKPHPATWAGNYREGWARVST